MVSAVETKLNGVSRSSLSLPSSQRFGRSNGSWPPSFGVLLERLAERGVEGQLLAVDLVALHDAEGQPQGERRVRRDRLAEGLEAQLGELGVRLAFRFLDLRSRSACAAGGLRRRWPSRGGSSGRCSRRWPSGRPRRAASARPGRRAWSPTSSSARAAGFLPASTSFTIGWSPPSCSARKVSDAVSLARSSPDRSGAGLKSWNFSDSRFESRYSRSRSRRTSWATPRPGGRSGGRWVNSGD